MQLTICDRCGTESKELHPMKEEFGGLEVCDKCWKDFWSYMSPAMAEWQRIHDQLREQAVADWLKGYEVKPRRKPGPFYVEWWRNLVGEVI